MDDRVQELCRVIHDMTNAFARLNLAAEVAVSRMPGVDTTSLVRERHAAQRAFIAAFDRAATVVSCPP
jgi:hypothetical protein